MSNDILEGQDGHIAVKRVGNASRTRFSDRTDSGTISYENPLVTASASQRGRLSQRVRGVAGPTPGAPCSCAMPTTRRGMGDTSCTVCGGDIA